jgi:hypothetical protein
MTSPTSGNRPNRPIEADGALMLPHGRYAGQPIEDVPTVELRWLLAFDVEGDDLREAIRQCLIARGMAQ